MSKSTRTGGREATRGVIPGRIALSVGKPDLEEPDDFHWHLLSDLARLESGHTPSRSKSEYWGGEIPWVGIRDATGNHGKVIDRTLDYVSQGGLNNSSARLLPSRTVCLSRTASVGYVVELGRPMATSQDFVNWVCGPGINSHYLRYIFMLEQESVRRFTHGTTHQTMYYPEAKALNVLIPDRHRQDAIAEVLGALDDKIAANDEVIRLTEKLMVQLAGTARSRTSVTEVSTHSARAHPPASFDTSVALFSLPAFDDGAIPEYCDSREIKSNKFVLTEPVVLISKLNPRIPRVWNVSRLPDAMAAASTEFVVLESSGVTTSALWAALSQPSVSAELANNVSGTSGSHQRVKPAEILGLSIPDPRYLPDGLRAEIDGLGAVAHSRRLERRHLVATRDQLLPLLMSGKVRVRDAERRVEDAL